MTIKEAITVLRNTAWLGTEKDREEVEKAVELAVEALKVQLSREDTTFELISRQEAIDALSYCQTYLFDSRDHDKKISLEDAEYALEQLQPAQSKQLQILADVLDGCPLTQPCDKLWPGDWCHNNCKTREPTAECWLRYAEVMASDDGTNTSDLQ